VNDGTKKHYRNIELLCRAAYISITYCEVPGLAGLFVCMLYYKQVLNTANLPDNVNTTTAFSCSETIHSL
jgi:hypothetical protein